MRLLILNIFIGLTITAFSHTFETEEIFFVKNRSDRKVRFDLPLKCTVTQKNGQEEFGTIRSVRYSCVEFEYTKVDTAVVNQLFNAGYNMSTRDSLLDLHIDAAKRSSYICLDQIDQIIVMTGDANKGRKLISLGATLGFIGTGFIFMYSVSNNQDDPFTLSNQIGAVVFPASAALMIGSNRKSFNMNKWQIAF